MIDISSDALLIGLCPQCQAEVDRRIDALQSVTKMFRSPLGTWLSQECDLRDGSAQTSSTLLWNSFVTWLESQGLAAEGWNITRFGRDLHRRGIPRKKGGDGNILRLGIRLRTVTL